MLTNYHINKQKTIEILSTRADYLQSSESFVSAVPVEVLRVTVHHPKEFFVDVMSLHTRTRSSVLVMVKRLKFGGLRAWYPVKACPFGGDLRPAILKFMMFRI